MSWIQIKMINSSVSPDWWKDMIRHFVNVGDEMEIRCWREETAEIGQASMYGEPLKAGNEVSVKGTVTPHLLAELLTEEPTDKNIYNKMTKYFTINVNNKTRTFSSEHYGTELYISGVSDDIAFISRVLEPYGDFFSISMSE